MANLLFELDKLRMTLRGKGIPDGTVEGIINKAHMEITNAMRAHAEAAMQLAIEEGVKKDSATFINELRLDPQLMHLVTDSGNMNFPEPPKPMLPFLLKNAKPMKDGSGVYKVIPVGSPSKQPKKTSMNIYDSWKQTNAERIENARKQYDKVAPKDTKFRTATSKQDASASWVQPAKENDFSEEIKSINAELDATMEQLIREIVRSYEEGF
jgi:hypothetical protein